MSTRSESRLLTMQRLLALTILIVGCARITAAQNHQTVSIGFLVNISEGTTDLSRNGASIHDCMVVLPTGRFHLEQRGQMRRRLPATLKVSESYLDSAQILELQGILDQESIRGLPQYVQPALPMAVPWSRGFEATIARGGVIQRVGYWSWRGGTPEVSPNSAAESVKTTWRASEVALRPLVDWFHRAEATKLLPSDAKSTLCTDDENLDAQ